MAKEGGLNNGEFALQLSQFIDSVEMALTELRLKLQKGTYYTLAERLEIMTFVTERIGVVTVDFGHTQQVDVKEYINLAARRKSERGY